MIGEELFFLFLISFSLLIFFFLYIFFKSFFLHSWTLFSSFCALLFKVSGLEMMLNKFYGALLVSVTPEKRNVCVPVDPRQARCCITLLGGFLYILCAVFPPCVGRQMASPLDPQLVNDLIITVSTQKSKCKENDWERRGKKQTNLGY